MPDNTTPLPKNDPLAFTFLVAVALAVAVVTGAALSRVASGAVQDLLLTSGLGQDGEIRAQQRRQALALEKIEMSFSLMRADVALLKARLDDAEKLRQEAANSAQGRVDGEFELGAPRTPPDEHTERNRHEFNAVNKRIDWLEKLIYSQDAAGSFQPAIPGQRQGEQAGWFVLHAENGVAVIAGKSGAIDVTPGFVVPDLGRVAAIRQEGGRWVVVMDEGINNPGAVRDRLTHRRLQSAHSPE
jgi:hypothetical protein